MYMTHLYIWLYIYIHKLLYTYIYIHLYNHWQWVLPQLVKVFELNKQLFSNGQKRWQLSVSDLTGWGFGEKEDVTNFSPEAKRDQATVNRDTLW